MPIFVLASAMLSLHVLGLFLMSNRPIRLHHFPASAVIKRGKIFHVRLVPLFLSSSFPFLSSPLETFCLLSRRFESSTINARTAKQSFQLSAIQYRYIARRTGNHLLWYNYTTSLNFSKWSAISVTLNQRWMRTMKSALGEFWLFFVEVYAVTRLARVRCNVLLRLCKSLLYQLWLMSFLSLPSLSFLSSPDTAQVVSRKKRRGVSVTFTLYGISLHASDNCYTFNSSNLFMNSSLSFSL